MKCCELMSKDTKAQFKKENCHLIQAAELWLHVVLGRVQELVGLIFRKCRIVSLCVSYLLCLHYNPGFTFHSQVNICYIH